MSIWLVTGQARTLAPLFREMSRVQIVTPGEIPRAAASGESPRWVIHWGVVDGEDPPFPVINRRRALARLNDPDGVRRRISLTGCRTMSRRRLPALGRGTALFRVALFDMQVYDVRRVRGLHPGAASTPRHRLGRRRWERVTGAAIRVLSALGLDAGLVDVALPPPGSDRRPLVTGIRVGPVPAGGGLRRLKGLLEKKLADDGGEFKVRLGADPEFMFRHKPTGDIAPASSFFPRSGPVGCDSLGRNRGRDYPVAEVRPRPSFQPDILFRHIRRCLTMASRLAPYRDLSWHAGAEPFPGFPTGGHIHFSGVPLSGRLLRALDTYLAVPMLLLEPADGARRRRRHHGFLGDVRMKNHGGFEYRTLASWLVSPLVARGVLHLAWLAAAAAPGLTRDVFQDGRLVQAFYEADKEPFYRLLPDLEAELSSQPPFGTVREAVEPLFHMMRRRREWDDERDLADAWELARPGPDPSPSPSPAPNSGIGHPVGVTGG